jgi:hypothetical protein
VLLCHHFEQGRLHLGRRPVDLVGENEVGEHRSELDVELLGRRPVDPRADDVGGQQVRGELQAGERATGDSGEGLHCEGLGEAGHALEEAVTPSQHAYDEALDDAVLSDDHLLDLEHGLLELRGLLGLRASRLHGPSVAFRYGGRESDEWIGDGNDRRSGPRHGEREGKASAAGWGHGGR